MHSDAIAPIHHRVGSSPAEILVVGDGIRDEYFETRWNAPNPEDNDRPKLVGYRHSLDGGGLNVARNIVSMGVGCWSWCPVVDVKYRVVGVDGQLVVRFDELPIYAPTIDADYLDHWLSAEGNYISTLVVADYNKGNIKPAVINVLARHHFDRVFIDTKLSPQEFSPITEVFGHACALLPNAQEYSHYRQLYDQLPNVVRTESQDGVSAMCYGEVIWHEQATTAPNEVVSVCGAGDTVTAAMAAAQHRGVTLPYAMHFAMKCAGDVVKQPMTATPRGAKILLEDLAR